MLRNKERGLYFHYREGGSTLEDPSYVTEEAAKNAGVKNPVFVPEGATFNIGGNIWVHLDRPRKGRPLTIHNGLPLTPSLDLPDPDR